MTATGERGTDAPPPPVPEPPWVKFRGKIIDRLLAASRERYMSLGGRIIGMFPVCRADLPDHLFVRFHGEALRADLVCSLGCPEADLAAAFGLEVLP